MRNPKKFIESGVIGGVAGAGIGILASLLCGGSLGATVVVGELFGTILGMMSTTLNVKISQYCGHSLVKILQ